MRKYPLKLTYAPAYMLWGGRRLITEWGKKCDGDKLAETWELTVRDDGKMSRIQNGEAAGLTLREYIEKAGNAVVSDAYNGGRFPLLIKFIDAEDRLSVQVHPDDKYASEHENDPGKTEMWYIVSAEPGAKIIYGLADGVTNEQFRAAVSAGEYDRVMKQVEVHAGESYFIPSGMLHAIGKGILIAEIQQNSDLTYRVYDYGRRDKDGKLRELHVKKAFDVVRPFTAAEIYAIRYEKGGKADPECLANSRYFNVRHIVTEKSQKLYAGNGSFNCLLFLDGEATISYGDDSYVVGKGDCWFIPAGIGEYSITGGVELLLASV